MDPFSGPFYGPKFGPPAKSRKRIKTESVVPIFGTRSFTAARLPQPRLYQPTGGEQTLVNQFLVQKWTCFWVPARRYLSMLYLACCCTKRTYREYNDSNIVEEKDGGAAFGTCLKSLVCLWRFPISGLGIAVKDQPHVLARLKGSGLNEGGWVEWMLEVSSAGIQTYMYM